VTDYPLTRPGYAVSASALEAIACQAAEAVDGVEVVGRRMRRRPEVQVDVRAASVRAQLAVSVRYGVVLPEAAEDARQRVGAALGRMTGLEVEAVDVTVVGIA
jgi:uncharacterized alkaline shock family protein YloU